MKGQAEIVEAVGILALIAMIILILTQIPKIFTEFFNLLALASANVVSRDLAGLISVSAVAPKDITIEYAGASDKITYNVQLEDRTIAVEALQNGKPFGGSVCTGTNVETCSYEECFNPSKQNSCCEFDSNAGKCLPKSCSAFDLSVCSSCSGCGLSSQFYAVDNIDKKIENENSFRITKERTDSVNVFDFEAI